MALVIIIAVAWIAILTPRMMRRRAHLGDGISSISNFHHQLRILEHSAPEPIVAPAYRLLDGGGAGGSAPDRQSDATAPVLTVVGEDRLPRPALAFLGDDDGAPVRQSARQTVPQAAPRQLSGRSVRRRRRDTLAVLAALFFTTLLIGLIPGARAAWVLSAVSGLSLVAYSALLVQLRKREVERSVKLRYLADGMRSSGHRSQDHGVAVDGGLRSGRFAHPSHPVWAAR